jgi:hypothetical protein
MPALTDLQAAFAGALLDPAKTAPAAVISTDGRRQSRRFDVYRNNVTVSLIEALEAAFPAVHRLVGAEFFKAAARVYVRQQPPRSPVMLFYGETFPEFLEAFEPAAGVPYLGDVARLEWARLKAYHAADAAAQPIACLASIPEQAVSQVTFTLHPSLTLLRSRFPVASLWAATSGAGPDPEIDLKRGEEIAVLRPDLEVELRVLPAGGYSFLQALSAGACLEQAASRAAEAFETFDLAAHLAGLFELGAVAGVHAPGDEHPEA